MFNSCGRQEDQDIFQIKRRCNTWLALCWHSPGRKQNTTMETTFQKQCNAQLRAIGLRTHTLICTTQLHTHTC